MKIEKEYLIFVEGSDDKAFFEKLLEDIPVIQIIDVEGKVNFKPKLKIISQDDNFEKVKKVLIIRDADESYKRTYQSLTGIVKEVFNETAGDILMGYQGKYGILILPPSEEQGSLEDLLFKSVESDIQKEIVEFVEKMERIWKKRKKKKFKKAKYKIHCYIGYECNDKLYLKLSSAIKNCDAFNMKFPNFLSLKTTIMTFLNYNTKCCLLT